VFRFLVLSLALAALGLGTQVSQDQFAGPETCAACHRLIFDSQSKTAMANSWHGNSASFLPSAFNEQTSEGNPKVSYRVRRSGDHVQFSVESSGNKMTVPVQAMIGGERHGISFMLVLDQLDGLALERPAMIEGRFALSHGSLVLSPGFLKEPGDYADQLGRVLSPSFEERCLTCHGKPQTLGAGRMGGVRCESCHGPATTHVKSFAAANVETATKPSPSINSQLVKPEHLEGARIMEVCVQCHHGQSAITHSDLMPGDVLVSSQVPALRSTQCFIQSGEKISCISCHNPHADTTSVVQKSVTVCLSCHSSSNPQHAALCPVDRVQGCVGCHMPTVKMNAFELSDHWIRVETSSKRKSAATDESLRSTVAPLRMYLRMIVTENDQQANAALARLSKGEAFSAVAHNASVDPTAPGGGFVGEMKLADMNPKLAAAARRLPYGGYSDVIAVDSTRIILYRMPRDFRWEANQLYLEAVDLRARGDRAGAIAKDKQALEVYPYMLRGLVFLATTLAQAGEVDRASQILQFAAQTYPKDARTQFALALTLGKNPDLQIEALRHAIELDPDMTPAYQSLGASLYSSGKAAAAIDTFRRGLQVDPLSAVLY
jgi:PPIC-type PPIASE domain